MPTPTTAEPNLRHAISSARADHAWWSTPEARTVLEAILTKLTPLAHRLHADPADALSHAFEVWVKLDDDFIADETVDLWAYTCTAVRHALEREEEAARKVTSAATVRRTATRAARGTTTLDDADAPVTGHPDTDTVPVIDARTLRAKAALEQVLTLAGFDDDQRVIVIDVLSDALAGSPSARASIARAEQLHDVIDTPLSARQWKTLIEVLLGTPAGKPGVVQLAASGHPAPAIEPHISTRLLSLIPGVAA